MANAPQARGPEEAEPGWEWRRVNATHEDTGAASLGIQLIRRGRWLDWVILFDKDGKPRLLPVDDVLSH
jgi:hypothetical protein